MAFLGDTFTNFRRLNFASIPVTRCLTWVPQRLRSACIQWNNDKVKTDNEKYYGRHGKKEDESRSHCFVSSPDNMRLGARNCSPPDSGVRLALPRETILTSRFKFWMNREALESTD